MSSAAQDPIAMALDVARAALATVEPAAETATAKLNRRLFADSLSSLERSLRILAWEQQRQRDVSADRAARAEKPAAQPQQK